MRHRFQRCDLYTPVDVLAEGDGHFRGRIVKLVGFENRAQTDQLAFGVWHFDTDRGFTRQALDQYRFGLQAEAEIFGQRGDTRVFHARFRLVFESRNHRAGVDLYHRAAHVEFFELRFDAAGDFLQFGAVVSASGRNFVQQGRGGQLVELLLAGASACFRMHFECGGNRLGLDWCRFGGGAWIRLVFERANRNFEVAFGFFGFFHVERRLFGLCSGGDRLLDRMLRGNRSCGLRVERLTTAFDSSAANPFGSASAGLFDGSGAFRLPLLGPSSAHSVPACKRSAQPAAQRGNFERRSKVQSDDGGRHCNDGGAGEIEARQQEIRDDHPDNSAGTNRSANQKRLWQQPAGGGNAEPESKGAEDAEPRALDRR